MLNSQKASQTEKSQICQEKSQTSNSLHYVRKFSYTSARIVTHQKGSQTCLGGFPRAKKAMKQMKNGAKIIRKSLQQSKVSSVAQSCPTLCDPMDCSTHGFPVHYQFPEFAQTHVHWVGDASQPSHPLSSPSTPAFNLSQHQGLANESVLHIGWPKYWSFSFSSIVT